VQFINRTDKTITYRTISSQRRVDVAPYKERRGISTHWWSSPDIAKIRIVGTSNSDPETIRWQSLETKYFDQEVPAESHEHELTPMYEFAQVGDKLRIQRVSPVEASRLRDSPHDDSQESIRWPYYADLANNAGVTIWVDHLQRGEWAQIELRAGEQKTIGSEVAQVKVRVCDCEDTNAVSPEEWTIKATEGGRARSPYTFYLNRRGKIDVR
jgi:hypothetical protein